MIVARIVAGTAILALFIVVGGMAYVGLVSTPEDLNDLELDPEDVGD